MKDIMFIEKEYVCPICGAKINKVKISREFIQFLGKNRYGYQLHYTCQCAEKINQIIDFVNRVNSDFTDADIANHFINASKKAQEQAMKNIGILKEE